MHTCAACGSFTPEVLGKTASSGLVLIALEVFILKVSRPPLSLSRSLAAHPPTHPRIHPPPPLPQESGSVNVYVTVSVCLCRNQQLRLEHKAYNTPTAADKSRLFGAPIQRPPAMSCHHMVKAA